MIAADFLINTKKKTAKATLVLGLDTLSNCTYNTLFPVEMTGATVYCDYGEDIKVTTPSNMPEMLISGFKMSSVESKKELKAGKKGKAFSSKSISIARSLEEYKSFKNLVCVQTQL